MSERSGRAIALDALRGRFRKRLLDSWASLSVDAPIPTWAPDAIDRMTQRYVSRIDAFVCALVGEDSIRAAVLDRAELAETWDLHDHGHEDGGAAEGIASLVAALLQLGRRTTWPNNVTPDDVAELLERCGDSDAALVAKQLRSGGIEVHETIEAHDAVQPSERLLVGQMPAPEPPEATILRLQQHAAAVMSENTPTPERTDAAIEQQMAMVGARFMEFRAVAQGRMTPNGRSVDQALDRALRRWPVLRCARVASVVKDVHENRRRRFFALAAGSDARAAVSLISAGPSEPGPPTLSA